MGCILINFFDHKNLGNVLLLLTDQLADVYSHVQIKILCSVSACKLVVLRALSECQLDMNYPRVCTSLLDTSSWTQDSLLLLVPPLLL